MTVQSQKKVQILVVVAVAALLLLFVLQRHKEKEVWAQAQDISAHVASDAAVKYDIAKRHGSAMDICIQAKITAGAYLQAKDEASYARWKETERADCARAGMREQ